MSYPQFSTQFVPLLLRFMQFLSKLFALLGEPSAISQILLSLPTQLFYFPTVLSPLLAGIVLQLLSQQFVIALQSLVVDSQRLMGPLQVQQLPLCLLMLLSKTGQFIFIGVQLFSEKRTLSSRKAQIMLQPGRLMLKTLPLPAKTL